MRLFIMRHGRAGTAPADNERRLSAEGRGDVGRVARRLAGLGERLDAILCSPLARARETAEIMAVEMGSSPVMVEQGLASGASVDAIAGIIRERAAYQALMIVGHNPEFGDLAGRLAGKSGPLELAAGQVVCLDLPLETEGGKSGMLYSVSPEDP